MPSYYPCGSAGAAVVGGGEVLEVELGGWLVGGRHVCGYGVDLVDRLEQKMVWVEVWILCSWA